MQPKSSIQGRRIGRFVQVLAGFILALAVITMLRNPHDRDLGEGDYMRVGLAMCFWIGLFLSVALFAVGYYLRNTRCE
jgi:hypothetical protein